MASHHTWQDLPSQQHRAMGGPSVLPAEETRAPGPRPGKQQHILE